MHEGPRVKSSGSSQNFQDAGVKFFRHQSAQCHIAHLGSEGARGANFLAPEKSCLKRSFSGKVGLNENADFKRPV